ncbi:AMP-binding protein [Mycobacterium riyadhense]|uniref:Linear gramicidin synthase subunit A n=1 Tax=Mycobacterium riyadhense TaxID=486698 RepID=A0A653EGT6_9MYCO|nr:AMP-binding protein [Mycobacterium riyadhense]VTO95851.1 Linear gramicidin synthase subunit A [Mycobacterium riyadhense]
MSVNVLQKQRALAERAFTVTQLELAVWLSQQSSAVSVPQLLSEQVNHTPEAIALVFASTPWTYRELEEAANRLAHLLAAHRVGLGDVIALLFDASAQAIIAMLAAWKVGAVCLSIDSTLPDAQVASLLDDAAPSAAITTTAQATRLADHHLLVIDIDDPVVNTSYPAHALPHPNPDNIAYIFPSDTSRAVASTSVWEIWAALLQPPT